MMPRMLHVGLTGNIGTGKSSAAAVLAELGAHIIDADLIAHRLLLPGSSVFSKIVDSFGAAILNPDSTINRRILGGIVFADPARRELLNRLIHPEVHAEVLRRMAALEQHFPHGLIVVDAALMVESGFYKQFDRLIVVTCDPAVQLNRIMNRDGLTAEQARARMSAQMPAEEKRKAADYTIETSGTFRQTRAQIEAIYRDLMLEEIRRVQLEGR